MKKSLIPAVLLTFMTITPSFAMSDTVCLTFNTKNFCKISKSFDEIVSNLTDKDKLKLDPSGILGDFDDDRGGLKGYKENSSFLYGCINLNKETYCDMNKSLSQILQRMGKTSFKKIVQDFPGSVLASHAGLESLNKRNEVKVKTKVASSKGGC